MASTDVQSTEPPRTDVVPDSYALDVRDERIHVWQYRVTASKRAGTWAYVETVDGVDGPYLTLEYAEFTPPTAGGYWVYCRSYDCELDCE
jgi:hypothetical protein